MSEEIFPGELETFDSSETDLPRIPIIVPSRMGYVSARDDDDKKGSFLPLFPSIQLLDVKGETFPIFIIPQEDGSVVTRLSTYRFSANAQGDSEQEALEDIKSAIELLIEEESNPSGDVEWPENYR